MSKIHKEQVYTNRVKFLLKNLHPNQLTPEALEELKAEYFKEWIPEDSKLGIYLKKEQPWENLRLGSHKK